MADFQLPPDNPFEVSDADQYWTDSVNVFFKQGTAPFIRAVPPAVMEKLHDGPEIMHASYTNKFTKVTQDPHFVRLRNAAG